MIYSLCDHERYIYHYTKASMARDFILKNQTLRLSSFTRTNDPKESKEWKFDIGTNHPQDLDVDDFQKKSQWLSCALKTRTKLACFSLDRSPLTGDHTLDILNRGLAKPRMWAQYADNHQGVCLVIDKAKLLEKIKEDFQLCLCLFGPVQYRNRDIVRPLGPHEFMIDGDFLEEIGPEKYIHNHLQRYCKELFFEKLLDWRDEEEWRIVIFAETDADLYISIKESLVGVVHGACIESNESDQILTMTEPWDIEHMGLTWSNSCPWYDIGNFKWSKESRLMLKRMQQK